jgi:hypothetical protein
MNVVELKWRLQASPDHAVSIVLPVEIEYEDGVISQFPLQEIGEEGASFTLRLGSKHTDCLAKDKCGMESGCCAGEESGQGETGAGCGDGVAGQGCCK